MRNVNYQINSNVAIEDKSFILTMRNVNSSGILSSYLLFLVLY